MRRPLLVFLGDYMDRGPECRGVLEALMALRGGDLPVRFLLGNHDSYVREYLLDPDWFDRTYHWLHDAMGGNRTLASYGVPNATWESPQVTHDAFARAFPAEHLAFIDECELMLPIGGYVFVHAGIRPGVALERQERDDLIWIREPFLSSAEDFGVKVVHGHTIVPRVEHHRNRIALDTGAVKTGVLSCLVLEGAETALLTENGPEPLPVGAGLEGEGFWRSLWVRR